MRKKYDAVATIGSYRNKAGEEKKRYITCGSVFEGDDGRLSLKLDAVPTSPEWTGWVAFYEPRDGSPNAGGNGSANGSYQGRQDSHNQAKSNGYQPSSEVKSSEDFIPF